jgi:hypothetical protein
MSFIISVMLAASQGIWAACKTTARTSSQAVHHAAVQLTRQDMTVFGVCRVCRVSLAVSNTSDACWPARSMQLPDGLAGYCAGAHLLQATAPLSTPIIMCSRNINMVYTKAHCTPKHCSLSQPQCPNPSCAAAA